VAEQFRNDEVINAMGNVEINHYPVTEHDPDSRVSSQEVVGNEEENVVGGEEEVSQEDRSAASRGQLQEYINNSSSCVVNFVSESVVLVDLSTLFPPVTTQTPGTENEEAIEEEDNVVELSDVHIASCSDDACCESGVVSTFPSTVDGSQCDEGQSS